MTALPAGWRRTGRFEGWRIGRGLRRTIGPDHELSGADFRVVARHDDAGEFLVALDGAVAPYFVLHVSRGGDAEDAVPMAFPLDSLEMLGAPDETATSLEDAQIFLMDPGPRAEASELELWVNPVAPVRCEKLLMFPGGAFSLVPLIGEEIRLVTGCSLQMAKVMLSAEGYVIADGTIALSMEGDTGPEATGQSISFWLGQEGGDYSIWSVLETPGEEFSMQRVDGDAPSVLFYSGGEELEKALNNRNAIFIGGRVRLH